MLVKYLCNVDLYIIMKKKNDIRKHFTKYDKNDFLRTSQERHSAKIN